MAVPDSVTPRPSTVVSAAPVMRAGDELAARLTRTEVQRSPSSVPGREFVQVLTEIPRGVESGWHTHPGEEVGYLIGGTVELCVEGQPTRTVRAGEGFLVPPHTPHNARDLGPGTGRMVSTYLVEVGQPLSVLTGGPVVPASRAGLAGAG
ncbi:cupin domain-containing protein [Modestobacter excelsi]|uniref:cupin domain-containing protein n=1 Tax=Modestobacter excelsi TaxID=2213161 RepID=UPI00110D0D4F|nr:cupin domain-containing protein [Modestobacter excelsi]